MSSLQISEETFEALLKAAVIDSCYSELEKYPQKETIDKVDDSKVDSVIRKLIKRLKRKSVLVKMLYSISKAAAIFLIILGVGFIGLLQADEVRASCINFIETTYEKYIKYDIFNENVKTENIFEVGYIPSGYQLIDTFQDEIKYRKVYENGEKMVITIEYFIAKNSSFHIDNEGCSINEFTINDLTCQSFIYSNGKLNKLSMHTESGLFLIKGHISEKELKEIAINLK